MLIQPIRWVVSSPFGNIIGVISFGSVIYVYFKGIKRIVYSLETREIITDELKSLNNLQLIYKGQPTSSIFVSELIIYNNGRKSINKEDVRRLTIKPFEGRIFECFELRKHSASSCMFNGEKIFIELNEFDARDYIALRILHESNDLELEGRIKESGEPLNGETKAWKIMSFIFFLTVLFAVSWGARRIVENDIISFKWFIAILIGSVLLLSVYHFIYSLFFIPSRITKKYFTRRK